MSISHIFNLTLKHGAAYLNKLITCLDAVCFLLLGSLSNNEGDGYKNVTFKVKSRCLKLYRAYSVSHSIRRRRLNSLLGTLRSNDADGKENVA